MWFTVYPGWNWKWWLGVRRKEDGGARAGVAGMRRLWGQPHGSDEADRGHTTTRSAYVPPVHLHIRPHGTSPLSQGPVREGSPIEPTLWRERLSDDEVSIWVPALASGPQDSRRTQCHRDGK